MGRGSENGFSDLDQVFAQIKGLKRGESARIEFSVKDPDNEGQYIQEGHESGISGKLVGVIDKSYTHEGDEVPQAGLILEDEKAGEVYFLSFGISMVGVNIINSLAGCNELGNVDISIWNDKTTDYAKVYVRNNGEKTEWAYPWEELKDKITYTDVKGKDKPVRDDWDLKQFMLKDVLMVEVKDKLPKREKAEAAPADDGEAKPATSKPKAKAVKKEEPTKVADIDFQASEEGDDPPF